ncbi:MAG: winged helix-turn-helix transcriptional regulator [Alphaproteobacteria bacterium]|nr:winged helix-turn-helix transcriptional regulator [Alphaproteobacteria bacterium]
MAENRTSGSTSDGDAEITLGLLNAVQENSTATQRSMANDLGIALGLANAYLKRCARKGLIKISQVPPNRYAYYLTPKGFREKSRLTSEYLSSSFTFFRRARGQCSEALDYCAARNWKRVALAGSGELAEIATLCAVERDIALIGMIDPELKAKEFAGLKIFASAKKLRDLDAIIVTDLRAPQAVFETLSKDLSAERVLTPPLLGVVRQQTETAS